MEQWYSACDKFSEQKFKEIQRNIGSLESGNFYAGADSSKRNIVNAMKSVQIVQQLVSNQSSWSEPGLTIDFLLLDRKLTDLFYLMFHLF